MLTHVWKEIYGCAKRVIHASKAERLDADISHDRIVSMGFLTSMADEEPRCPTTVVIKHNYVHVQ